jgi:PHS family inorganic phosphate transporter-like MFS transporter
VVGLSLIPAFGTLYQRLTLAESTRFIASQEKDAMPLKKHNAEAQTVETNKESTEVDVAQVVKKKAHFRGMFCTSQLDVYLHVLEFLIYFSEWRHAKLLIGTCMCWFLLDIALVQSMNSSVRITHYLLTQILWNQFEPECRSAANWV